MCGITPYFITLTKKKGFSFIRGGGYLLVGEGAGYLALALFFRKYLKYFCSPKLPCPLLKYR